MTKPVVRIAPNNPVFDLPVIVGIEEGLFEKAGLDVSFSATYADRERDSAEKPVLSRLKEQMFECGSADSYNVCRPRATCPTFPWWCRSSPDRTTRRCRCWRAP